MKRSLKKAFAAFSALALMMSATAAFSGCAGNNDDGTIRLRWVSYCTAVPADMKEVIAAANKYSAEKIGVTVDLEVQPTEMLKQF